MFSNSVNGFRQATRVHGSMDAVINLLSMMRGRPEMMEAILRDFIRSEDRSAYGLMNTVTATARETADPQRKWNLEKLGGSIPARLRQLQPADRAMAARQLVHR